MTTTPQTEALHDLDGNCICKLDGCPSCNPLPDDHACTGDNCYCIGGDENLDLVIRGC